MANKRLKTLNLDDETVNILDNQLNASKYARMAILRYRELLNEVAHQTIATDRNWQDLKLAAGIIHTILKHGAIQSRLLLDALDMDDHDYGIWEQEDERGYGVDFIIGRIRLLGLRERA